jgi:hypothetical protein
MKQQASLPGLDAPLEYGDDFDFYATPRDALEPVLPFIPRRMLTRWNVLEPAAGTGSILRWLIPELLPGCEIVAVEVHKGRFEELARFGERISEHNVTSWCGDFLKDRKISDRLDALEQNGNPWLIPFNPPYSNPYEGIGVDFCVEVLRRAERVPGSVVAGLLPADFCTGVDRVDRVHAKWKGSFLPLKRRPYFGGEHGSGQRPFAWFVWDLLEPRGDYRPIG